MKYYHAERVESVLRLAIAVTIIVMSTILAVSVATAEIGLRWHWISSPLPFMRCLFVMSGLGNLIGGAIAIGVLEKASRHG